MRVCLHQPLRHSCAQPSLFSRAISARCSLRTNLLSYSDFTDDRFSDFEARFDPFHTDRKARRKRNPPTTRAGRKGIVIYVDQDVAAAIRRLATEMNTTVQALGSTAGQGGRVLLFESPEPVIRALAFNLSLGSRHGVLIMGSV